MDVAGCIWESGGLGKLVSSVGAVCTEQAHWLLLRLSIRQQRFLRDAFIYTL